MFLTPHSTLHRVDRFCSDNAVHHCEHFTKQATITCNDADNDSELLRSTRSGPELKMGIVRRFLGVALGRRRGAGGKRGTHTRMGCALAF